MDGKDEQDRQWNSLQTFLGMDLPNYTKTQLRNLMKESQESKTRAKRNVAKKIDEERVVMQKAIKTHYGTTIKTPKWFYFKKNQHKRKIPGTIMYIVSDLHRPVLDKQKPITGER